MAACQSSGPLPRRALSPGGRQVSVETSGARRWYLATVYLTTRRRCNKNSSAQSAVKVEGEDVAVAFFWVVWRLARVKRRTGLQRDAPTKEDTIAGLVQWPKPPCSSRGQRKRGARRARGVAVAGRGSRVKG